MKGNYTLMDKGYFDITRLVLESFRNEGVYASLVGGSGIQAHIANLYTKRSSKKGGQRYALPRVPDLRSLLRPTGDIDLATISEAERTKKALDDLVAENEPHIIVDSKEDKGAVIIYNPQRNGNGDLSGTGGRLVTKISLDYQESPKDFKGLSDNFYFDCVNEGENLEIPYGRDIGIFRTAKPVYIITSKLTDPKPKDFVDLHNLVVTMRKFGKGLDDFDLAEIERHLDEVGKREKINVLHQILEEAEKTQETSEEDFFDW